MPAKPTLLVISQVFPPDPTAVGQYMHDAATEMARRGWRVIVFTANRDYNDPSKKFPPRDRQDGVEIVRLPLSSLGKKTIAHRLVAQSMFLLQVVLRGFFISRLKCILVSTSPPMASIAALAIRLVRRASIKFWVMDLNPDQIVEMGKIEPTSLAARGFDALNRAILASADDVVALDRFMGQRLNRKRNIESKLTVLPPWPHFDSVETVAHADNPFRKRHALEGKFVVMYSGNHGRNTSVCTILDAAVRMQDRPELLFMFVGGGVGKRDVEATIERFKPTNVVSLPYQPFDQIKYSLSAADVHVVTMDDAMVGVIHPCKVYGAMALARPILFVGPDPSHVGDIMQGESVGWHVRQGDVEGAVATLDEMRKMSRDDLKSMGDRAAQVMNRKFRRSEMIETFGNVLARETPPSGREG